jgi:flagellar basal body-associated protein FliL
MAMNIWLHKHKVLFAVFYVGMPVLLAWIGWLVIDYKAAHRDDIEAVSMSSTTALYALPRVALTMDAGVGQVSGMMKLDIGIEVKREDLKRVIDYEPRILERILMYMRKQDYAKLQEPDSVRWIRRGLEEQICSGAVPISVASVVVNRMVFE